MLEEKLKMYEDAFGDCFPTFCFMSYGDDEIIKIIDSCLDAEKDVYEMGYLKEANMDVKY